MTIHRCARLRRFFRDQSGQALPLMALCGVLFIALGGITVDLGRAYSFHRQLQASTDAAALAGAYALSATNATVASVQAAATSMSAASTGSNASANLPGVQITATPQCLTTVANWGVYCSASSTGDNAIQVIQTAPVNTVLLRVLGVFGVTPLQSLTLKAESTAAMRGATNEQYNVAIIIDTTASMGSSDGDANCNNTRIYCALAGVRVLLQSLTPCSAGSTSSNCKSAFDSVAMFTFPPVVAKLNTGGTLYSTQDTVCTTSNPNIPTTYYLPAKGATWAAPTTGNPTYQITPFLDDYSAANAANAALATGSGLVVAAGGSGNSNCKGMGTPGGLATYLAGSIYAAQSALVTAQKNTPGSQNAMIILSDGAANTTKMPSGTSTTSGTYPSTINQCQQSVAAANYATQNGTTVYTIAYGASNQGGKAQCTTDPTLSPCTELQQMASAPGDFYSDATAAQNTGQCTSASNPNLNLNQIFKQVATSFTNVRLIPNGTT